MVVAKNFKWEAAHRLPRHEGKCRHLHGHSYAMTVEFEGDPDENGMVIDFNDIKKIIGPHVDRMDHTTLISINDAELLKVFEEKSWKYFPLPFESTAENLCSFFTTVILDQYSDLLVARNIHHIGVKIFETGTSYASLRVPVAGKS